HPFRDARPMGDGFVAATTLPLVYLAYPLWLVGGYRASLLWPMVGAVGAAFVARGLARRLGDRQDGWPAFWLAGLASPLAIYALDLWEHTLGVALMGAGILLLVDVCGPGPTGRDGAVDGDAGDAPPPGERTPIGAA